MDLIKLALYLLLIATILTAVQSKKKLKDKKSNLKLKKDKKDKKIKALKFFRKFGYIDTFSNDIDAEVLKKKVRKLQKFASLPVTGELNDATLEQLDKERCGLSDPDTDSKRKRRYLAHGTFWEKKTLRWYLNGTSRTLQSDEVREQLKKAFQLWSDVVPLNFQELPFAAGADIEVSFGKNFHGDPYPFDGPGGILAHAFYPLQQIGISGDLHFDDDETFSVNEDNPAKKDLLWIAVHEIGHALGLEHSTDKDSIMFAWYRGYQPDFVLGIDDVMGIQSIYGAREEEVPIRQATSATTKSTTVRLTTRATITTDDPPPPPLPKTSHATTIQATTPTDVPQPPPLPKTSQSTTIQATTPTDGPPSPPPTTTHSTTTLPPTTLPVTTLPTTNPESPVTKRQVMYCPKSVDAVFKLNKYSQYTFIISGDKMWLERNGKFVRQSLSVSAYFPKLDGNIDAAYMREDGKTVFFVGRQFYIYESLAFVSGPTSISNLGLPDYVDNLSSAQMWVGNGMTYYYYKDRYWREEFDQANYGIILNGPFSLTYAWEGIPEDITATGTIEGRSLFFKDDQYYDLKIGSVRAYDGYPQHHSRFFECSPVTKSSTLRRQG